MTSRPNPTKARRDPEWIKCSERMPEFVLKPGWRNCGCSETVLAWVPTLGRPLFMHYIPVWSPVEYRKNIKRPSSGMWEWDDDDDDGLMAHHYTPTHWMPLPPPPTTQGDVT